MRKEPPIVVYEHESLKLNQKGFSDDHLLALQRFHGEKGTPYFSLIHNGVKFSEYVGVLKVGSKLIEILPKADRATDDEQGKWRSVLIHMLRSVGTFTTHAPSHAPLTLKSNFILELYFQLYIQELEKLSHQGLVKQYHQIEGNRSSLKGSLYFPKHIQQNFIHQERFYTRHTTYSPENVYNQILLKGLKLVTSLNSEVTLSGRISNLLLNFPELKDIPVSSATFQRLTYNRK
jgi:5-methylcytosine-specific restriction enzyme subunit McrC